MNNEESEENENAGSDNLEDSQLTPFQSNSDENSLFSTNQRNDAPNFSEIPNNAQGHGSTGVGPNEFTPGIIRGRVARTFRRMIVNPLIRVARFASILGTELLRLPKYSRLILSIIANFGNLFVPNWLREGVHYVRGRGNTFNPAPEHVPNAECPTCDLTIPLVHLAHESPRSPYAITEQLLGTLTLLHGESCNGRDGLNQWNEVDDQILLVESNGTIISSDNKSGESKENILKLEEQKFNKTHKFKPLPLDRFKLVKIDNAHSFSNNKTIHSQFPPIPEPRQALLYYFFIQAPSPNSSTISISDARSRIREVHYDRGKIDTSNEWQIKAKEMAVCKQRYDSFQNSVQFNGATAYQLAQLGFFYVRDGNTPENKIVGCSFCRRTFMFTPCDENTELSIASLIRRHSLKSCTCPFQLGLNGDDKRFSNNEIAWIADSLSRTNAIAIIPVNLASNQSLNTISHEDVLQNLGSLAKKIHQKQNFRLGFDSFITECSFLNHNEIDEKTSSIDEKTSDVKNALIAELEYETCTEFNTYTEHDYEVSQDLTPFSTPIDYYIGIAPKHLEYWSTQSRIDSFEVPAWHQQPISQWNTHMPESFAKAGLFYTGTSDNVSCFWCGLGLNQWERTDDPFNEHARFKPCCTWLLRTRGRQRVKALYMNSQSGQSGAAGIQQVKLAVADYAFIKDVEEIAGVLYCSCNT